MLCRDYVSELICCVCFDFVWFCRFRFISVVSPLVCFSLILLNLRSFVVFASSESSSVLFSVVQVWISGEVFLWEPELRANG